ncbi:MAG: Di-/tripeptide transporter [Flavobacteriales bacterium]|mgnify:CR=1 FL=1|nr:peptide MFS transporter [Flavobacteriales bacterium]MBV6485425.1 Di-/tripeptide transporter [Flavobacteriales bacterium]
MDNKSTILGHPAGLFTLFFTEMWERFSYYGMRALLVLFLVSDAASGGWSWSNEDAAKLYAFYTGLVYITPILGGLLADKLLGYRKAVVLGAVLMTAGHASMALETPIFFYLGLALLILGNGAFKPNISTIVGGLYPKGSEKKDAGYTIFYMGINAGAFLGILLCGYIGEKVGWSYGFGLAGIFMFIGMVQFWFGQGIFGDVGLSPKQKVKADLANNTTKEEVVEENPVVVKDRLLVIGILAFFTIFFWWAFEQAGSSMTIFAKDFTERTLTGSGSLIFKWVNTLLTIIPLGVITVVLGMLFYKTVKKYPISVVALGLSFAFIWYIAIWMLMKEFDSESAEIPASWFGVLNSLFIIIFAPLFSKLWETKFNPAPSVKFAMGLILLGLGFGILAFGASAIPQGAEAGAVRVSLVWLVLAYLLHTLGELVLSPVGLSYVSKLAPARLVGMMFGLWFTASAIANFLGGITASFIDKISEAYSLSVFFLIFTAIPILAGLILISITPIIKKKMHGVH